MSPSACLPLSGPWRKGAWRGISLLNPQGTPPRRPSQTWLPIDCPGISPQLPASLCSPWQCTQRQAQHDGYVWPSMVMYLLSETDNFH